MSEMPNVKQNNEQILNDIQSLQQMEQQLFNGLESNPNMTPEQQQKIVQKMNQLSNMRVNLYQTLSGVNNYFENVLNKSVGSLQQQAVAIEIVESELNKAKKRLEILEEEKNNKIRLVEINTYYGDKYAEHAELMKIIIFTLIPIIIIGFLNNKGIIPSIFFNILLVIISGIGAYFFWRRFASIISRDNMNYQEYDWYFDQDGAPTRSSVIGSDPWEGDTIDPWKINLNVGSCVGNSCCSDGLIYDTNINKCVLSTRIANDKESFVNQILTKQQPGNYKIAYDLKNPEPFNK